MIKIINQLKLDKEAFDLLVGKEISHEEIHSYSLTSILSR